MQLGDSFILLIPPEHLWFVVSDPSKNDGAYVVVNLTSDYFLAGKECILNPGEHPWITKTSYICFSEAQLITAESDKVIASSSKVIMKQRLSQKTLDKIIEAAKKSKAIPVGLKKYL